MKRNLRQSILFVLIVLMLINSSCQPDDNYSPQSDFQEDTIQGEPEPQTQPVDMEPVVIFDNINTIPHSEFPPIPPTFTLTESWRITSILVCHWNQSKGVEPGEITLLDDQGNLYGTWQSEGFAPEPQFPNTYWRVKPDLVLGPGTYIIYDSDPATETYNTESGNMGMARIKGFPDSGYLNTDGIDGIVSTDSFQSEEGAGYTLEEIQVKGVVTLPRGSGLSFSELTVETLTETEPVDADGVFITTSLHTPDAPQLAMALNQQGNPVLMGMFGAPEFDGYGLSVESTARAFVLFDMAVLTLAPEKRASIAAALDKHPSYTKLQEMVAQAIMDDPVDPLLGDNNPELYELAAWMTADLLNQAELLPRASVKSGIIPISMMKQDNNDIYNTGYIDVEDDKEFGPEVVLVNKSMVYYKVDVTVDGQPWAVPGSSKAIILSRNDLYGTLNFEWPPASYRSTFEPKVGDGLLSFTFTLDKQLTMLDLIVGAVATVLGVGEVGSGNKDLIYKLAIGGELADGIQNLIQAFPPRGQLSYTEAVATYSKILLWDGGKLLWAIGGEISKTMLIKQFKEGMLKNALKFYLKKIAAPAMLAYGSADAAAILYSYNAAPESAVFKDEQRFGFYPAMEMKCMAETDEYKIGNPISFSKKITTDVPKGLKLYYEWDFDDGMVSTFDYEDATHLGSWIYGPENVFNTNRIYNVKVTAMAEKEDRPVAECIIPVEIGEEAPCLPPPGSIISICTCNDGTKCWWNGVEAMCSDTEPPPEWYCAPSP